MAYSLQLFNNQQILKPMLLNHSIVKSESAQDFPPGYLWAGKRYFSFGKKN